MVYIITDREEDVFLSLETLEERTRFIEVFWEKRDPYPATPANEFKDEHYARIEYANQYLGRDTFRAGWRTDRGRYYILLGEPRERHSFDGYNEVVSSELWFYQGDVQKGLPSFFYLVFFKRHDIGEYRLYHPVVDGPQSLVRGQYTQGPGPEGNVQAYETLQRIDAELANASLSFDPSEPGDWTTGRASLSSDLLIARVEDSPRRAIRTDYADAWLRYRDRVSADYSFNFVPSRGVFGITGGPSGTPFVHFSVEIDPQNFTLETDEDQTSFYTTLDISVEAVNEDDVVVLAIDRPAYLELTPAQVRDVQASPFAYQDSVPLLPGQYEFSVIVRNRAAQQFTVLETEIDTTGLGEAGSSRIAGVVAGFDGTDLVDAPSPDAIRTFQVGSVRVQPAADGLFALGNVLYAFAHVMDPGEDQQVRFQLLGDVSGSPDGEALAELTASVPPPGAVLARMPLDLGVGGSYWLRARLEDADGALLDQRDRRIQVSPRAGVPRAGVRVPPRLQSGDPGSPPAGAGRSVPDAVTLRGRASRVRSGGGVRKSAVARRALEARPWLHPDEPGRGRGSAARAHGRAVPGGLRGGQRHRFRPLLPEPLRGERDPSGTRPLAAHAGIRAAERPRRRLRPGRTPRGGARHVPALAGDESRAALPPRAARRDQRPAASLVAPAWNAGFSRHSGAQRRGGSRQSAQGAVD